MLDFQGEGYGCARVDRQFRRLEHRSALFAGAHRFLRNGAQQVGTRQAATFRDRVEVGEQPVLVGDIYLCHRTRSPITEIGERWRKSRLLRGK